MDIRYSANQRDVKRYTTQELRDEFLKILDQSHKTSTDLFQTAQSKGWYQVEQAPASKVSTAYTRFSNQTPQ